MISLPDPHDNRLYIESELDRVGMGAIIWMDRVWTVNYNNIDSAHVVNLVRHGIPSMDPSSLPVIHGRRLSHWS